MADETVTTILKSVADFQRREGGNPDRDEHLVILNQGLDEISIAIGGFETHWNNDSTDDDYGTLTLSSATVTYPDDVMDIDPKGVYWNDVQLAEGSVSEFDAHSETWRTDSGTPTRYARTARGLVFNSIPDDADTDGLLTIWGKGKIPHLASNQSSIAYLPGVHQLSLRDYVLANLPIDYRDKEDVQVASMQAQRQRAAARWDEQFKLVVNGIRRRRYSPASASAM